MLKFDNPALKPFIVLLFAFSFNDALSTPVFGGIPITPVQIAVLYGIFNLFPKTPPSLINQLKNLKNPVIIYYTVILASSAIAYLNSGFDLSFLTIGFNLLWFLTVYPFLAQGLNEQDIDKFLGLFLKIILFITIPSGLYELITHKHIMNIQYGLSESTFYLRGFHIDKLEFGSMLATGAFISLINFFNKSNSNDRLFYCSILLLSTFLIAFSFSTTSMMGCATGISIILLYKSKKSLTFLPFILLFGYFLIELIQQSELFEEQVAAYELKYALSVERYEEKNFRYQAFMAALDRIVDEPLLGYGVGQSGYVIQETLFSEKVVNSHNIFANEMLDYGLIGFLPLLIFILKLYNLSFKNIYIKKPFSNFSLLRILVMALGVFLIFRFILYYHRFDQTFYFIWAALVVASYGTYIKLKINESKESINMCETAG